MMTRLLIYVLDHLAKLYLWRYRPTIVAITGNSGKTTTKEAVAAVMAVRYRVRATGGNLNNELGAPLTVIGDYAAEYYAKGGTLAFWFGVLLKAPFGLFLDRSYPQVLVLEYGADHPGDIARMTRMLPPHVSVVTQVGQVPVHVEFFASAKHLAAEKMQIIRRLGPGDHAVLNYDDQTVLDMRHHTKGQVHTFGLGEGADVRAMNVSARTDGRNILGLSFDLALGSDRMPATINGTLGRGIAAAGAAAVAVGLTFGIGLADAVQAICRMRPPAGRLRILRGVKNTTIIDDTYNASPAAMHLALETVKDLPAGRKVLVLGDMLELGEHSVQAHQSVGDMAGDIADILVCIGEKSIFMADSAANQMLQENIHRFHDSAEAASAVKTLLKPGDIVLVKGSQGKRMEKIVKEIMAEPDRAGDLLVRQSIRWLNK